MNERTTAVLFVSGAGLPSWIWDDVIARLPNGTAAAVAPRPAGTDSSLDAYVRHAVDAAPGQEFTIVGHSIGAIVGLAAAVAVPERVAELVAVAGAVPSAPGSFLSAMPIPNRWVLSVAMRVAGTRPPDKAIRSSLGAGLDRTVLDRLVDEFESDSQPLFRTSIAHTDRPMRRGYIHTSNDAEFSPKLQQRFADALDPAWTTTLATGHLPMLEDSAGLAAAISEFTSGATTD